MPIPKCGPPMSLWPKKKSPTLVWRLSMSSTKKVRFALPLVVVVAAVVAVMAAAVDMVAAVLVVTAAVVMAVVAVVAVPVVAVARVVVVVAVAVSYGLVQSAFNSLY